MLSDFLRELKSHKKNFLFLLLNLSFGISGLVMIISFKSSFESSMGKKGQSILGSDLSLRSRSLIPESTLKEVQSLLPAHRQTQVMSLFSMLSYKDTTRLVNIKTVTELYPFYGEFELKERSSRSTKIDFVKKDLALWIPQDLANQLELKIGDKLAIGQEVFSVDNIILSDPNQSFQFTDMVGTVYMSKNSVDKAKLNQAGSTIRYAYHYQFPDIKLSAPQEKKLVKEIETKLNDASIRVITPSKASAQVGRFLRYFSDFLGLVALVGLFLSSTGIFYLFRSFIASKRKEIAIFRSLGRTKKNIFKYYLFYLSIISMLATLLGLLSGILLFFAARSIILNFMPIPLDFILSPYYLSLAFLAGLGGPILTVAPLLKGALHEDPASLFRESQEVKKISVGHWSYLPLILFYSFFSYLICQSVKTSVVFILSFLLLAIAQMFFFNYFLKTLEKRAHQISSFSTRHALLLLSRNRTASLTAFFAIAQGFLLITFIPQLHSGLSKEIGLNDQTQKPSLFMIDIQEEQVQDINHYFADKKIKLLGLSPMISSKLLRINEQKLEIQEEEENDTREEDEERRIRNRGVNLSYRDQLGPSERVISGRLFTGVHRAESKEFPELSIESRYADRLGVDLGDVLTFDILGMEISAKITSIRKVLWTSFLPNFFLIFQPGVLEEAPKTFLGVTEHLPKDQSSIVERDLFKRFPNVSVLNISKIIESVSSIFLLLSFFMSLMAALSMLTGFFVLYSILIHQVETRARDLGLFKILGAKKKFLETMLIKEFCLLTFFASLFGLLSAVIVSFIFSKMLFDGLWAPLVFSPFMILVGLVLLVALLCFLVSKKILKKRSAELVRPFL